MANPFRGASGASGNARHPQTPGAFGLLRRGPEGGDAGARWDDGAVPFNPRDIVLPEGYYHTHFLALARTVHDRYSDLMSEDECRFVTEFLTLQAPAQKLFVRLSNRVGPWFRISKLKYPEIGDCSWAARELMAAGFGLGAQACEPSDALALLTLPELKTAFPEIGKRSGKSREEILEAVLSAVPESDIVPRAVEHAGEILAPAHADVVRLLKFLYFGNSAQDMTDFVLADMGLMRYESYALDASTRSFTCRESLRCSLEARDAYEELFLALEQNREDWETGDLLVARDALLARLATFHPRSHRRLHKALNLVGNRLERAGELDAALVCYLNNPVPPARERTVRLMDRARDWEGASALARDILTRSRDEGELAFAYRFLVKTLKFPEEELPLPEEERDGFRYFLQTKNTADAWPQRKLTLPQSLRARGVENAVLEAAGGMGFEGFHAENLLWRALFGLVFWEDVFAPVPGAFHHPYQMGPTDAQSSEFFPARRERCEATLAAFAAGEVLAGEGTRQPLIPGLKERWERKVGIANPWVHWAALSWEAFAIFLGSTPRDGLTQVLRKMLRHPGRFDSGFPDLFLLREGAAHFWEVKGPGDQLRPEQKSWLSFLHRAGMNVAVMVVEVQVEEETE